MPTAQDSFCDHVLKILLVGDSGVGKSCLLERYTSDRYRDVMAATVGVDFRVKHLDVNALRVKLTIWDTAGQERFRTLASSYYRGAQGVIMVYDVTKRESFSNLEHVWLSEIEMYTTVEDAAKIIVANKVDLAATRQVSTEEGREFARQHGCLFVEASAKANVAVCQAFEELVQKIAENPELAGNPSRGLQLVKATPRCGSSGCYC